MNGVGIQPQDLFQSSPDGYGIQLNAVATNIHIDGTGGYQFWTQNVAEYFPTSDALYLVSNIWNFSGGSISSNSLASTTLGPGCIDDFGAQGALGYYYSECLISGLSYPFNLTFYMTSSISTGPTAGQNNVTFEIDVTVGGTTYAFPYDQVEFNSIGPGGHLLTTPSPYTANGFAYNPLGLTNDFELIVGGPGGGSNADLAAADASLSLGYWDASTQQYTATPSAYSYGGETGETVMGANVAWASGPSDSPGGLARYATMTEGPSVLRGLWHAGGRVGSVPVQLAVNPANAWYVFTPINTSTTVRNFLISQPIAVSALYGDTFWLTPGTYVVSVGLSDYAPVSMSLGVHTGHAVMRNVHLHPSLAFGVYTPLWAFSNSQLAAISFGGQGTPQDPYVLFNNQYYPLPPVFGLYNDWMFPTYPGVFLMGTTATTYLDHSADFTTMTNTFQYPGPEIPSTNQLQFWFWNVQNVALVDSTISGWFGSSTYYPAVDDTFNVIFYESSHNLVAGNQFLTQGDALLLASAGTFFGPYFGQSINLGGGNNTIWGNYFTQIPVASTAVSVAPVWYKVYAQGGNLYAAQEAASLGMQIAEDNDLIYNNYVATPTTAWMLPLNLYSGFPFAYTETWNITPQPASITHFAAGFPLVPLVGSIVGGPVQAGNYWWDYGVHNKYNGASNPQGLLPYHENALTELVIAYGTGYYFGSYIYNGGDYAPLTLHGHHTHAIDGGGHY